MQDVRKRLERRMDMKKISGVISGISFALVLAIGIMGPDVAAAAGGESDMESDTQETQLPGAEQQEQGAFPGEATGDVQQTEIPSDSEQGGASGMESEGGDAQQPTEAY
jgi:hypothetical protein